MSFSNEESVSHLVWGEPLVLVLAVPILLGVGWVLHRSLKSRLPLLGLGTRNILLVLRLSLLALLLIVLADPKLKSEQLQIQKPALIVLVDTSSSMKLALSNITVEERTRLRQTLGSEIDSISTRSELASLGVRHLDTTLLDSLQDRFEIQRYGFNSDLHPLHESAQANGSDLGSALQILLKQAIEPAAGIIILGDGENTRGPSPLDAAREAKQRGTPIFTIPIGGRSRYRDVAIVEVESSGQVSIGDTAKIGVVLESHGFDGEIAMIALKEGDTILDRRELRLLASEQQRVEFSYSSKILGVKYLTVEVTPLAGEEIAANNTDLAVLRVNRDKLKILYLEGLPRWDFRFLKNALRRDPGITGRTAATVDVVLEAEWRRWPEDQRLKALPRTLEELSEYHAIILGDVSPKILTENFIDLLERGVREKGVGLLIEAGPLAMPHGCGKNFQSLLPVQLEPAKPGIDAPTGRPFSLVVSREGSLHDALRLTDDPSRNATLWNEMLPFEWCAASVKPAPAATVLAWNPESLTAFGKRPLIAWHFAGEGRVMFVGLDSTWLWRQNVADRFFNKFWGQSLRFVARREDQLRGSRIEVTPSRPQPGETIQVEFTSFSDMGVPLQTPSVSIQIASPAGESTLSLTADPQRKGHYLGQFNIGSAGEYRFRAASNGEETTARIVVASPIEEWRHPNVNRTSLRQIADASGGKMIELDDPTLASTVLDTLKGEAKRIERKSETTLWDNRVMLFLLVGIFCAEIALRRRAGLR